MAYSNTVDERYIGGYIAYGAGTYDAPSSIYSTLYTLAPDKVGYGFAAEYSDFSQDKDVYALGSLSPGYYSVDVDKTDWDWSNNAFGFASVY